VQEDEGDGGGQDDERPHNVELPPFYSSDREVGDKVGDELRGIDNDPIKVEVEAELVDEHDRGVVEDIDCHEEQAHKNADLSQRLVPEEVDIGECLFVLLLYLCSVLMLQPLYIGLAQQLVFFKPLQPIIYSSDELEAFSDLPNTVPFDKELGSLLDEEVGEHQAAGKRDQADDNVYDAPGFEYQHEYNDSDTCKTE